MPTFNQLNIYLHKQGDKVKINYAIEGKEVQSKDRYLNLSAIQELIGDVADGYYVDALNKSPAQTGQQLYEWLDDNDRFLERAINDCPTDKLLVIAFQGSPEILHLPWELLHNDTNYLVQAYQPQILPVRLIAGRTTPRTAKKQALQLLFMATAPADIPDFLDYEGEEAKIVAATEPFNLEIEVEESGNLQQLEIRYAKQAETSTFDVVHLSGHASYKPFPHFMTEDDYGKLHRASAEDLYQTFPDTKPSLLFLSGCHTGEATKKGTTPSLAQALLEKGFPAILAWARPVFDTTATDTATLLYKALSKGTSLPKAIHTALETLSKDEDNYKDWHLLRLYANGIIPDKFIERGDYPKKAKKSQQQFLDPFEKTIKVPSKAEFVGRRREIQKCLKTIKNAPNKYGVILQGMGGLGKSSLAARVCDRLESTYKPIVIVGKLQAYDLLRKLAQNLDDNARNIINQYQQSSNKQELTYLLQAILEQTTEPKQLLIVLDDFEQNFETDQDGNPKLYKNNLPRLTPEAAEILDALLTAQERYEKNNKTPQLLITSRYNFETQQTHLLELIPLARFKKGAWQRFQQRKDLKKLAKDAKTEQRCLNIADGNPRLLEWLITILKNDQTTDQTALFEALEAKEQAFRENILADYLLKQQDESVKKILKALTPYEIPVPYTIIAQATQLKEATQTALQKATNIALIDQYPTFYGENSPHYRLSAILKKQLPEPTEQDYHQAATLLNDTWKAVDEIQIVEITRVGIEGKNKEVLEDWGVHYLHILTNSHRYKEALLWGTAIEKIIPNNPDLLIYLGRTKLVLGETEKALADFDKATQHAEDEKTKSILIHDRADIFHQKGDTEKALELYQQALDILEKIGDQKGKSATLHQMAGVLLQKGETHKAFGLYQQALDIDEKIGDQNGKAATLNNMAQIVEQQGETEKALEFYKQSLDICEKIGNQKGKSSTLHNMAETLLQKGEIEQALELFEESLKIKKDIGDVEGIADTSYMLAQFYIMHQQDYQKGWELIKQSVALYDQMQHYRLAEAQEMLQIIFDMKLKHELSEEKYAIFVEKVNKEKPEDWMAWLASEGITF